MCYFLNCLLYCGGGAGVLLHTLVCGGTDWLPYVPDLTQPDHQWRCEFQLSKVHENVCVTSCFLSPDWKDTVVCWIVADSQRFWKCHLTCSLLLQRVDGVFTLYYNNAFIMNIFSFCYCYCSEWDMEWDRKRKRDKIIVSRGHSCLMQWLMSLFFYVNLISLIIDISIQTGNGADDSQAHTTSLLDAEGTFKPEPEHSSHRATPIFITHYQWQTIAVFSLFIRNPVHNLTAAVQKIEAIKAPSWYQTLGSFIISIQEKLTPFCYFQSSFS